MRESYLNPSTDYMDITGSKERDAFKRPRKHVKPCPGFAKAMSKYIKPPKTSEAITKSNQIKRGA